MKKITSCSITFKPIKVIFKGNYDWTKPSDSPDYEYLTANGNIVKYSSELTLNNTYTKFASIDGNTANIN